MFIVTARLPRRALALGGLLAALVLCMGAVYPALSDALPALSETSSAAPNPKGVRSNEDRVEYLGQWGWEVSPEPVATQELIVPDGSDESCADYFALQSEQGFDLTRYAGKRVKRYTYEVTNYPSGETGIQVNLLLYRNTVVGGEVLSPTLDGFMHGLARPEG